MYDRMNKKNSWLNFLKYEREREWTEKKEDEKSMKRSVKEIDRSERVIWENEAMETTKMSTHTHTHSQKKMINYYRKIPWSEVRRKKEKEAGKCEEQLSSKGRASELDSRNGAKNAGQIEFQPKTMSLNDSYKWLMKFKCFIYLFTSRVQWKRERVKEKKIIRFLLSPPSFSSLFFLYLSQFSSLVNGWYSLHFYRLPSRFIHFQLCASVYE